MSVEAIFNRINGVSIGKIPEGCCIINTCIEDYPTFKTVDCCIVITYLSPLFFFHFFLFGWDEVLFGYGAVEEGWLFIFEPFLIDSGDKYISITEV